jgi:hypothetical protein
MAFITGEEREEEEKEKKEGSTQKHQLSQKTTAVANCCHL